MSTIDLGSGPSRDDQWRQSPKYTKKDGRYVAVDIAGEEAVAAPTPLGCGDNHKFRRGICTGCGRTRNEIALEEMP